MANKSFFVADLRQKHRDRYRNRYFISESIPTPTLTKTEGELDSDHLPCTDLDSFFQGQNKNRIACSDAPSFICHYIINQWLRDESNLSHCEWLVLIKADKLGQGLDNAICDEILQCSNIEKRSSTNYDDLLKDIRSKHSIVIIEGKEELVKEDFKQESVGFESVVFCVEAKSSLHTQLAELWQQHTSFYFEFHSNEKLRDLENKLASLAVVGEESLACVSDRLEQLCDKLSDIPSWPAGVQGMYIQDGSIVIDVEQGSRDSIHHFLVEHATDLFKEAQLDPVTTVVFVEQEDGLDYCVHRGGAICNVDDPDVLKKVLSSPKITGVASIDAISTPDKQSYGTVACVSKYYSPGANASDKQYCVLTSRHIFEKDLNVDSKSRLGGNFFGDNDDKFDRISQESYGILGHLDKKGVDISVIPVQPSEIEALRHHQPVPIIYKRPTIDLLHKQVEKLGATMQEPVTGIVVKTDYRPKIGGTFCKDCILVIAPPESRTDVFCQKGDSGSLVISQEDCHFEVVGMVTKGGAKWKDTDGNEHKAAIVVLMKNCFEAIEQEFNIKLELCELWEKCSVQSISNARV